MRVAPWTPLLCAAAFMTLAVRGPAAQPTAIPAAAVKLGRPVDFERDVYPILEANCIACHNAGIAESKLSLESADSVRKGGKRGPAVVAKNPDGSLLLQLASRAHQPAMPPLPNKVEANALTSKEVGILKQWILEGAGAGSGTRGETIQWQPIPAGMNSIQSVALSTWGRFLAAGRANQVFVYDAVLDLEITRLVDPVLSDVQFEGRPMYPGGAADRDFIHALAFSPDESLLAVGGYRVVKIWKRPQDVKKRVVALPDRPAAGIVALSADGSLIAQRMADGSVALISSQKGKVLRKLAGLKASATVLGFSSEGKKLYVGSGDGSWSAWDAESGTRQQGAASSSPVTSLAIGRSGLALVTGHADGVVRVWQIELKPEAKQAAPRQLKGHAGSVTALAVTPDGSQIVSGGTDGSVRVWNLATGKQVTRSEQGGAVTSVAVRPDGKGIASAGLNSVCRLWDMTGKKIAECGGSLAAERLVVLRSDAKAIAAQHVAAAVARVKAAELDVKDRKEALKKAEEAKTAAAKAAAEADRKDKAAQAALTASEAAAKKAPKDASFQKKLADAKNAAEGTAQGLKTAADALKTAVRGLESAVKGLQSAEVRAKEAVAEKGLAEASQKRAEERAKEAVAAAARCRLPIRAIAFSKDGALLATAGDDAELHLWETKGGRALETFHGHAAAIAGVRFIDNSSPATVAADNKLIVWNTNPAWTLLGRIGPKADAPLDLSASPFVNRVLCVAFNREGTLLATGGGEPSRSGELKIWNVPSLTLAKDLKDAHSDTVFGVDFSHDGKYLASCAADKFIKVFEVKTGRHVRSFEGHTHHVLGVSWKADGSALASAGADNQIKVWNFETGEQSRTIAGYAKQVTSIQFLGAGDTIVSSGGDKTVRLHRAGDGGTVRTFDGSTDFVYSAAASRDAQLVVAGGEDGVLRLWNGANGRIVITFGPPPTRDSAQASAVKR